MTVPFDQLAVAVWRLQDANYRGCNAALARLEITLVQWHALRYLDETPDASLHDIAVRMFQSDQAFGTLAGRLVDRELIERVPGPGRAVRHRLTARGVALLRAGDKVIAKVFHKSFGAFTPKQIEQLETLLAQALQNASR